MPVTLSHLRSLGLVVGIAGLSLLAGCQRQGVVNADNYPQVSLEEQQAFIRQMQGVLTRDMLRATDGRLYGALNLHVKLDKDNRPVGCTTQPVRADFAAQVADMGVPANSPGLAEALRTQCWKTLYPVVPAGFFDEHGVAEIVAPLVLAPPEDGGVFRDTLRIRYARERFFWQAVVRDEPVDSIGRALFRYKTDATGTITGCLVQLAPTDVRPDAFRLDGALQARLSSRCMGLQAPLTPGFAPDPQGPELGLAIVEYAPWKVGR